MLLRIIIVLALLAIIVLGIRRIYMDWTGKFKADDEEARRLRREHRGELAAGRGRTHHDDRGG